MQEDQRTQGQKFEDMARELECEGDEPAPRGALNKIAHAPPIQTPDQKFSARRSKALR
jgi:hypothetical protein